MKSETPSQTFVNVTEIRNGIVILKNGQMCAILLASSINFTLKSSTEQQAILSQFQALLNTLDFSFQIYVQSRRLDIRPYIELLKSREVDQYNDLMRIQLREYIQFITAFMNEGNIMKKNFFVVIPYTPGAADVKSSVMSFMPMSKRNTAKVDEAKFEEDRMQLEQRVTVVEQGLARVGVRTVPLGDQELTELFYHIYNPEDSSNAPVANA